MALSPGIEPGTFWFVARYSIQLSYEGTRAVLSFNKTAYKLTFVSGFASGERESRSGATGRDRYSRISCFVSILNTGHRITVLFLWMASGLS